MHIVILSPSWPRQGAANGIVTYCDSVVKSLKMQGHEVSVLARRRALDMDESEAASAYIEEYQPSTLEKIIGRIGEFFSPGFSQYYFGGKAILSGVRTIEKKKKPNFFLKSLVVMNILLVDLSKTPMQHEMISKIFATRLKKSNLFLINLS